MPPRNEFFSDHELVRTLSHWLKTVGVDSGRTILGKTDPTQDVVDPDTEDLIAFFREIGARFVEEYGIDQVHRLLPSVALFERPGCMRDPFLDDIDQARAGAYSALADIAADRGDLPSSLHVPVIKALIRCVNEMSSLLASARYGGAMAIAITSEDQVLTTDEVDLLDMAAAIGFGSSQSQSDDLGI